MHTYRSVFSIVLIILGCTLITAYGPIGCGNSDGDGSQSTTIDDENGDDSSADFTDNGDGTVLDNVSGLLWQLEGPPFAVYYSNPGYGDTAEAYCADLDLDGGGWRVPTADELTSLVDTSATPPTIVSPFRDYTEADWYWTSDASNTLLHQVCINFAGGQYPIEVDCTAALPYQIRCCKD